ncbi:MAG: hypothetical protein AAFP83_04115, partial [Bacteroidota bacterium]
PNDSEADQEIPLTPTGEKPQSIDVASLARGLWRIQVTWETADTPYYWGDTGGSHPQDYRY